MVVPGLLPRLTPLLTTFVTNLVGVLLAGDGAVFLANLLSLGGWGYILVTCCMRLAGVGSVAPVYDEMDNAILTLEGVCLVEVARIALGATQGNIVLGCVLHYTRYKTKHSLSPQKIQKNTLSLSLSLSPPLFALN